MTVAELTVPVAWAGASHLALWRSGAWLRGRLLRDERDQGPATERAFQSVMLGVPLLGGVALGLGLVSGLRPILLGAIVAALALLGVFPLVRRAARDVRRPTMDDVPLIAAIVFVAAHLPHALYPVLEHDENVYHLLL